MRKFLYALLGTVAGLGGLIGLKANLAPAEAPAQAAEQPAAVEAPPAAADPSAKAGDAPAADAAPKTVTGAKATNQYESFAVKVTVTGKQITKVEIDGLAPKDARSKQVTGDALPKLQKATLAANSADVDAVSGATYTTKSYKESLQSALDQAGL